MTQTDTKQQSRDRVRSELLGNELVYTKPRGSNLVRSEHPGNDLVYTEHPGSDLVRYRPAKY